MSAPFWKADPRLWPVVMAPWIEGKAGVWPEELMREDLAWHLDQLRVGHLQSLPGRRSFRDRWQTTERTARKLLRELGEEGPRPRSVPPVSRERPTSVPPVSHERPAAERENLDNEAGLSRERPAGVPPVSRERPTCVHTRGSTEPRAQSTEHRAQTGSGVDSRPLAALSTRAQRALEAVGLDSIASLAALTRAELLKREGIGKTTANEVGALLAEHGLQHRPGKPSASTGLAVEVKPWRDAWCEVFVARVGKSYPLEFHADNRLFKRVAALGDVGEAVAAFERFHVAQAEGKAFPFDEPPTIAKFCRNLSGWFIGPSPKAAKPRGSPAMSWADELFAGPEKPPRIILEAPEVSNG